MVIVTVTEVIYKYNNHLNRTSTTLGFDIPKNYSFTLSFYLFRLLSTYSLQVQWIIPATDHTQRHTHTEFLWMRDQPVAVFVPDNTEHSQERNVRARWGDKNPQSQLASGHKFMP